MQLSKKGEIWNLVELWLNKQEKFFLKPSSLHQLKKVYLFRIKYFASYGQENKKTRKAFNT